RAPRWSAPPRATRHRCRESAEGASAPEAKRRVMLVAFGDSIGSGSSRVDVGVLHGGAGRAQCAKVRNPPTTTRRRRSRMPTKSSSNGPRARTVTLGVRRQSREIIGVEGLAGAVVRHLHG